MNTTSSRTRTPHADMTRYPAMKLNQCAHLGIVMFNRDAEGRVLSATWKGGDLVGITPQLLREALSQYLRRDGDFIHIMQYTVKIIGVESVDGFLPYTYICQRIEAAENEGAI